jgi:hypothetical protein
MFKLSKNYEKFIELIHDLEKEKKDNFLELEKEDGDKVIFKLEETEIKRGLRIIRGDSEEKD